MTRKPISHLLVLMQLAGVVAACYPPGLVNRGGYWPLVLCALGTVLGIVTLCHNKIGNFSVYPELKRGAKLITTGPYEHIRHPMYSALILMMAGIALYNGHPLNYFAACVVTIAVISKSIIEERLLPERFPEYRDYQRRTKRFIPLVI